MAHGNQQRTCEPRPASDESTQFRLCTFAHEKRKHFLFVFIHIYLWRMGDGYWGKWSVRAPLLFIYPCILWLLANAINVFSESVCLHCARFSRTKEMCFFSYRLVHSFISRQFRVLTHQRTHRTILFIWISWVSLPMSTVNPFSIFPWHLNAHK